MNSNTYNENKLGDNVINQIKGFEHSYDPYYDLTEEQKSLINELVPNEELRERYKKHGLCKECRQPNTGLLWCQACNSKHFQQDFNKWTSCNKKIDEFIQNFQLSATCWQEVLEWIPYEKFEDIEYLAKGGFSTVYKAKWNSGYILCWDINQSKWDRSTTNKDIVLKYLNNSRNPTTEFLQEVQYVNLLFLLISYYLIVKIYFNF
jgi:hypothetical protein